MQSDRSLGDEIVRGVRQAMQVDAEWSVDDDGGFSWWGHRLRQRIWAEEPRESHGERITLVAATTDLLEKVRDNDQTLQSIAAANAFATMSALVYDPGDGRISSRCRAYFHAGNRWLEKDLQSAIALQAATAHAQVDALNGLINGRVAATSHPVSGSRDKPDDMLNVSSLYASQGARKSPFSKGDFAEASRAAAPMTVLSTYDEHSMTAELQFRGRTPVTLDHEQAGADERRALTEAYVSAARQTRKAAPVVHAVVWLASNDSRERLTETAMLQLRADEPHPTLEHGLLALLHLPTKMDRAQTAQLANTLNLAESTEWTDAHLLGAWCTQDDRLVFASFQPNLLFGGADANSRRARIINTVANMAIRAQWAATKLSGNGLRAS